MATGSSTARWGRAAFLLVFVAVMGSAAWWQYDRQRVRADRSAAVARASAQVLAAVVGTENAARDYIVTRDTSLLAAYDAGRLQLAQAVRVAGVAVHGDEVLRTRLAEERTLIDGWESAVAADVAATGPDATANAAARAAARDATLDRIRAADDELARALDRQNREDSDQDEVRGIALLVGVCAAFGVLNWVVFVRTERRDAEVRDRQIAFAERLQSARTEDEARAILAGHLEELVPGATVVVTGEDERRRRRAPSSPGATASARSCSARIATCGTPRSAGCTTRSSAPRRCSPRCGRWPTRRHGRRPIRSPAWGTDGWSRTRSSRAAAQAQRTGDGFAVAMIDVDRFKRVNDTFGHEAGDALLVAIADALSGATREYDVVGRHGGDEFIVLLPGLDIPQATIAMERCRAHVAALAIGTPPVSATASFGVAASPPGGPCDPIALVRGADEAVYEAKARGGNTVIGRTLANV